MYHSIGDLTTSEKIDDLYILGMGGSLAVSAKDRRDFFLAVDFTKESLDALEVDPKDPDDDPWGVFQELLAHVIRHLRIAYYEYNNSKVTDHEFDRLYRGLQLMEEMHPERKLNPSPTDEIQ